MKTPSKKLLIILGVVVVLVVVIYQLFAGNYNKLVKLEENGILCYNINEVRWTCLFIRGFIL